ncbi:hypothetical protein FACS1894110_23270 [Spirochaetia bacterium]|nr:hypothetical protein FACS1894110_23270 [Spirochaetia bacterium]
MKYNYAVLSTILLFYQLMCFSCVDKNKNEETKNIIQEKNNANEGEFNNELEIKLFGYYMISDIEYIYEIKQKNNQYSLSIKNGNEIYYNVLSGAEMQKIYNYIKTFDITKEIEARHGWVGSEGFYGNLTIKIDNEIYIKKISHYQDDDSDVFKIIYYLNTFTIKGYEIPL